MYSVKNQQLCKIKLPENASIRDVKAEIAKKNTKLKVERQSVRLELKGKDQKDETSLSNLGLRTGSKIYVKDLGPQISWRGVFVLEYFGPLVVYLWVSTRPWIFYGSNEQNNEDFSTAAK